MRSKLPMLLLPAMMLLNGCETLKPVPVAVECPSPPQPPPVVTKSVSDRKPLVPQLNVIEAEFSDSLRKAMKPK